jgi:hypothetical protein
MSDTATFGISMSPMPSEQMISRTQGMDSQLKPSIKGSTEASIGEHFPDDESGPMLFLVLAGERQPRIKMPRVWAPVQPPCKPRQGELIPKSSFLRSSPSWILVLLGPENYIS